MNPFAIFKALRDLSRLVDHLNEVATTPTGEKRWSLAYTNRSTIAYTLAVLLGIAAAFGVPIPLNLNADMLAEHIYVGLSALMALWGLLERMNGVTRAIWNRTQGEKAKEEADALDEALRRAGVK